MRTRAPRRTVVEQPGGRRDVPAPPVERVLAMQRGAGNQAVARWLSTGSLSVARGGRPKIRTQADQTLTIAWDGSRRAPGGGPGGSQQDHTTAYSSFELMIEANVIGKTLAEAKQAFEQLLSDVQRLPGWARAPATGEMVRRYENAKAAVAGARTAGDLETAAWEILTFRQSVPLSSKPTHHGGHGREDKGALKMVETQIRNNRPVTATERQIGVTLWGMLDLIPTDQLDPGTLEDIFKQHLVSMALSCPGIFATYDTMKDTMVDLLESREDDILYFWQRLNDRTRKPDLIAGLRSWSMPPLGDAEEVEGEEEEERERKGGYNLRSGRRVPNAKRGASGGGRAQKRIRTGAGSG